MKTRAQAFYGRRWSHPPTGARAEALEALEAGDAAFVHRILGRPLVGRAVTLEGGRLSPDVARAIEKELDALPADLREDPHLLRTALSVLETDKG